MNELAICSGVGMLSEGVRAACEFLGLEHRTVCHIEREAPAAGQLVALMEANAIDPAPIWSDLLTFDSSPWRGKVDCITAGFPCQPHSMAGKRKGTEDDRWIWPKIGTIIRDVFPRCVYLENVRGLLSSGGFEACLGSLACMGFDVEWGVLRASETGATHQRERVFILAYRKGERFGEAGGDCERSSQWISGGSAALDNANGNGTQRAGRAESRPYIGCSPLVNAECTERRTLSICGSGGESRQNADWQAASRAEIGSAPLGDAARQLLDRSRTCTEQNGSAEPANASGRFFAPGPLSDQWSGIIADHPHLAPAIEPGLRMLVNGMAYVVDESRADQLRQVGNGVVALQAASAFIQLARRAGIVG